MLKLATTIGLTMSLVLACSVHAADDQERFAIRGAGVLDCKSYLEEVERKGNTYYMLGGWIDGYLTAYNQYEPDTYDGTSFETTELLAAVIATHCQSNPEHRVYAIVASLLREIHEERIQSQSDPVVIKVGDKQTALYQTTLRRVQQRLADLGHYGGSVDGQFGDGTSDALKAFQEKAGLEATGFPDQTSLWQLLRGGSQSGSDN
jgi:hypothetical protein